MTYILIDLKILHQYCEITSSFVCPLIWTGEIWIVHNAQGTFALRKLKDSCLFAVFSVSFAMIYNILQDEYFIKTIVFLTTESNRRAKLCNKTCKTRNVRNKETTSNCFDRKTRLLTANDRELYNCQQRS